jgi:PilZ domain
MRRREQSGVFTLGSLREGVPGERREGERVRVNALVSAMFGGRRYIYRLLDISRGGARLARDTVLRPTSLHRMEIHFGGNEPLRLLARVVRTTKHSHAVRFVALDDCDRLEIAEVIDMLRAAA